MVCRKIMLLFCFILFLPQAFSLKVLSFEKLKFVRERNNLSSFILKYEIDQVSQYSVEEQPCVFYDLPAAP